jgi:hypothetical protein
MDPTTEKMLKELTAKSCSTADLSHLSNPNLAAERMSREFVMMLRDQSSLLNAVSFIDRADCKGEITRFDSTGISAAGACATSCIPGSKIDDSYITYDMVKYKVGHSVDEDMLDCNKMGDRSTLNNLAMSMLMTKMKNNMELAAILGDEDLPTGDDQSAYNNLMGVNDGWLKLALAMVPDCQIIDAAGAGPSRALFMAARKAIPTRYRPNRSNYRFVVGPSVYDWWVEESGNRVTDAGDRTIDSGEANRMYGNEFFEVSQWPEALTYGGDEVTHILFTPLNNLLYFVRRQIEIETKRRIECDDYLSVGWFTSDFAIAEPEAMVLIKNVDPCGTAWTGCKTTCIVDGDALNDAHNPDPA